MSMQLNDEEKKLVAALYSSRQLERIVALFQNHLDDVSKQLIIAGPDMFQRIQGRAQQLNDLISAFKMKRE